MVKQWTEDDAKRVNQGNKPLQRGPDKPEKKKVGRRGAKRTEIDGIWFDSKMEGECYNILKGSRLSYKLQVKYILQPKFEVCGKVIRELSYTADFVIINGDQPFIIDVKGHTEPVFLVRRKLMLGKGFRLTTANGVIPFTAALHLIKAGKSPDEVYEAIDHIHNS